MHLHARRLGDQGPDLLILHGLFGSAANWNWHAKQFSDRYRVHALDLRNHGQSPHADHMDYPHMAEDVRHYLDHAGLATAHVLGHSMGGKVAMQLALDHPGRVATLIVADIAPVDYSARVSGHEEIFVGLEAVAATEIDSRAAADAILSQHVPDESVRQFLLANLIKAGPGGFQWRFNLPALRANYPHLLAAPKGLGPYPGPTLFLRGELSAYIRKEHQGLIEARFPAVRVETLSGTGHWLHAEQPSAFNQQVSDFLAAAEVGP